MAVQITLNQTGAPAGVAGFAREDFVLGVPVVASASGGPFSQYRWTIASKPVDVVAATRSGAGLSAPTSATTQISPIDVRGTHRITLLVDAGFGLGARLEDVATITFYAGPPLDPDPTMLPRREPAFGERAEHNVPDALDSGGNPDGWAREWARVRALIDSMWIGRLWAGGTVVTSAGPTAALQRAFNLSGAAWNSGSSMYDLTFETPLPDAGYSVLVTPQGAAGANGFVVPRFENIADTGFSVAFTDDLSTGGLVTADFSVRVELGRDPSA